MPALSDLVWKTVFHASDDSAVCRGGRWSRGLQVTFPCQVVFEQKWKLCTKLFPPLWLRTGCDRGFSTCSCSWLRLRAVRGRFISEMWVRSLSLLYLSVSERSFSNFPAHFRVTDFHPCNCKFLSYKFWAFVVSWVNVRTALWLIIFIVI